MNNEFYIGQTFEETYPPEAVMWVNFHDCGIDLISENPKIWQIKKTEHSEKELKDTRIIDLENYLASTDWYATRYAETGVEIPEDVKQQRQSAREEISRLREELESEEKKQ